MSVAKLRFNGGQVVIPILFTDGTETAPSIASSSFPTTGMFFPTTNEIAFTNAGAETIRITSSGQLGVGTKTPSSGTMLHAAGSGSVDIKVEGTGDVGLSIDRTGSTVWRIRNDASGAGEDNALIFTGGVVSPVLMTMTRTSERVGIGLDAPLAKLHIDHSDSSGAIPALIIDQADVDEPFTKYIGTAASAVLDNSLVDVGDVTTFTAFGYKKIEIQDDGSQITNGDYYVEFGKLA